MKMYYEKNNINLLVINILDMNYNTNSSLDVMIKVTAMPNILNLNNTFCDIDSISYTIPQFEHYFSFIDLSVNNYMIYKLNINDKDRFLSIEFLFLYNDTDFCITSTKEDDYDDNYLNFKNETNSMLFKFIDERNKNGKRSLIIQFEQNIKEIYLIIFIKNDEDLYDKAFFALKYYSFTDNDYYEGKYLYKNRYCINSSNVRINKKDNNYIVSWDKIDLIKKKEEKGEIKIDYYFKILNKYQNRNIYNYNNGLFNTYVHDKNIYGFHLINKNEYELNQNIINKKNVEIYLIARFNEINGMENIYVYQPLILDNQNQQNINDIDKEKDDSNKNGNNIQDNNDNNIEHNNKKLNKKKNHIFLKAFIFVLIIILILLIILYVYKLIRKIQIKAIYDKYIKESENKLSLFNDDKSYESKISFLIEKE